MRCATGAEQQLVDAADNFAKLRSLIDVFRMANCRPNRVG